MRTLVITPPDPIVSWERAKDHLRLDDDEQQALVEAMIAAATQHIDGPMGWLNRSIGEQTIETRFDLTCFGRCVPLPYGPVISLTSIKYLDANGIEQTADVADFELIGDDLVPAFDDFPWAGGSLHREAGRVRYVAGFPQVPAAIEAAILLMVGDLFHSRATITTRTQMIAVPMSVTVETLLAPFRRYR